MAIGSVSASSRSISAPEAVRTPPPAAPRASDTENPTKVVPEVKNAQKVVDLKAADDQRTSRQDKDSGTGISDLYQAPSAKQAQSAAAPAKAASSGTYVNVTA